LMGNARFSSRLSRECIGFFAIIRIGQLYILHPRKNGQGRREEEESEEAGREENERNALNPPTAPSFMEGNI